MTLYKKIIIKLPESDVGQYINLEDILLENSNGKIIPLYNYINNITKEVDDLKEKYNHMILLLEGISNNRL